MDSQKSIPGGTHRGPPQKRLEVKISWGDTEVIDAMNLDETATKQEISNHVRSLKVRAAKAFDIVLNRTFNDDQKEAA